MRLILGILLVMLIIGLLPVWPYASNMNLGYFPSGGLLVLLVVAIILTNNRGGQLL